MDSRALEAATRRDLPGDDIRRGDPDDPLAGVVRIGPADGRAVDVVADKRPTSLGRAQPFWRPTCVKISGDRFQQPQGFIDSQEHQ
jgi:hypothetical protein